MYNEHNGKSMIGGGCADSAHPLAIILQIVYLDCLKCNDYFSSSGCALTDNSNLLIAKFVKFTENDLIFSQYAPRFPFFDFSKHNITKTSRLTQILRVAHHDHDDRVTCRVVPYQR